jgi:hypothetical protein
MKKLYFLDENEKNRILSLHESAIKRQYLSEQPDTKFDTAYNKELMRKYQNTTPKDTQNKKSNTPSQDELNKRETRWKTDLKCVPTQPGAKKIDRADKTTSYQIGNIVYYNTGRKKLENGTMTKYTCATEFKPGVSTEDNTKKVQEYRQQIITKTSDTTKQIQALLGLDPTGEMDTGLLQKINDKLNGKPQEAPKADVTTQPRPQVEPLLTSLKQTGVVQQQLTTPSPEQLTAGLQQMQQKDAEAAKTPLTNKEKRQQIRDLKKANKAELQALRDKQRGNQ